jgi:hypothetical protein
LNLFFSLDPAIVFQPLEIAFTKACMSMGCCTDPPALSLASAAYAAPKGTLVGAKAGKRNRHCSGEFM